MEHEEETIVTTVELSRSLYDRIKELAELERRSIRKQLLVLLEDQLKALNST